MNQSDSKDYLTELLNRKGLFQEFEKLDEMDIVQVLFFDLDNFKTINDIYGHHEGDETLIHFSKLVQDSVPANSMISRLGGDEFVAIIPMQMERTDVTDLAKAILEKRRLLKETYKSFEIISSSIGIVHNYLVKEGLGHALSSADKALYYAKEKGKDTFVFYDDYQETINFESQVEMRAVKALQEDRFKLLYHPVVHLHSSKLISSEVCCMWEQEDGTLWDRKVFRPILEKNGFIKEVDLYVFEKACADKAKLIKAGRTRDVLGVQFTHTFLLDDKFLERLEKIMSKYGVESKNFEINFDEKICGGRTAMGKMIAYMKKLSDAGFSIALSRFGEDFSSVRYLKELPISSVKLDGEFINENIQDESGKRVLNSIVKLGRGFKFTVVANRVNDVESMMDMAMCGCDAATGNYFSKRLPFDEYLEYIKNQIKEDDGMVTYHFKENLKDDDGINEGIIVGEGIELVDGITPNWGAISFPGGQCQTNYVKLPNELFEYSSYTVSMWLKPYELQNWVSAIYIRYMGGFMSFMPNIAGGRCIYRLNEDRHMDVWYDAMSRAIGTNKWVYVTCSYDSFTEITRLYLNGEFAVAVSNVPNLSEPTEVWLGGDTFQISYCGLISALQISKGAMTADAIRERYEEFIADGVNIDSDGAEEIYEKDIGIHDPAIFEDPVDHHFYIYGTEANGLTSGDLLHWKNLGKVVDKPSDEAIEWTKSEAIWAPDIVKVGDEYRLYCSNSSFGVQQSCIFLAVANSPKGPFIPKAVVLKTDNTKTVNGIDANIIEDHETGQQYLLYGSFWGGIHMIALDKETGLALEGEGIGKQVACRPRWNDGSIEGPYMIYHPDTQYYYLFVSYGSLMSDYNIRVGRSKCITGPFLDYHGRDLIAPEDPDCSTGLMIACGYRWLSGQAYMGPGHNSVLLRENGDMYLVNHIRKLSFNSEPGPGLLQIRKMIMTPDGWPIALGQPYNAETLLGVRDELLIGEYQRIELRPTIPQGIQHAHPMKLLENGVLQMASVMGTWKRVGEFELELQYGSITEFVHFEKGLDHERNRTTVVMGGLNSMGICSWAKKEELVY